MKHSERTFGNLPIVFWHGTVVLSWLFLWGFAAECRAATACDFQHETFDHYSNGSSLHGQGGWIGWEDNPAATAFITQDQSLSSPQSVDISGDSDLVHPFCASGSVWSYSAWQYIPSTFSSNSVDQFAGSYFIFMNQYPVDANPENDEWSIQMQFDSNDGMLKVYHGNGLDTINVPYDTDRWVKIQAVIDLDEDWTRIYYDDTLVAEYQWTGGILGEGGGNLDISAVDLYANGSSSIYYDDLKLEQIYPVPVCGEPGIVKLEADLNRDLFVTLPDLMLFASFWLEGISLSDIFPTCDDGSVDLFDYAWFAQQWQQCIDPTNPNCIHKPLTLKEPPSRSINLALPQPCGDICTRGRLDVAPDSPAHGIYLFSGEYCEAAVDLRLSGRHQGLNSAQARQLNTQPQDAVPVELADENPQGLRVIWARSLRTRTGKNTEIGNGWDYSYNIKIEQCGADFILHAGNNRQDHYIDQTDGTWMADGFFRVLTQNPNETYTLTFPNTGVWSFRALNEPNAPGKISAIIDRNDNRLTFDYDALGRLKTIRDTLNRDTLIYYNTNGFIESVTDFTGRTVSYDYYYGVEPGGSFGDLKSVTTPAVLGTPNGNDFPNGKTTTYTYTTGFSDECLNHNLLTITDPNGRTFLQNTYASTTDRDNPNFDRVIRQSLGNPDDIIDLTYVQQSPQAGNHYAVGKVVTNDAVGNVEERYYDNRNQLVIERKYTGRADPNTATYLTPDVNPPTDPVRAGDPPYFETRYEYNDDSLTTRIDFANGNYMMNVYELDLNPIAPRHTQGNLRERRRFAGALESISEPNELVELFEYATGQGGCGCAGTSFVTRYVDPRGNETLHDYDPNGNRIRTIYPTPPAQPSIIEEWRYNEFGQVTHHFWPNDGTGPLHEDLYIYNTTGDQNGYLMSVIVDVTNLALTTTFTYDAAGNVIAKTDANGNTASNIVNELNQIVRETSPAPFNYKTDYFYDARDNLVRMERLIGGNTVRTQNAYDILDRTIRIEHDLGVGGSVATLYQYDGNGNLIDTIDPEGNVTRTTYDERDLPYQVTKAYGTPEATTETSHYDGNGNSTKLYNGRNDLVFDKTYDGFDRMVAASYELGYETSYSYDPVGNRISETNANDYTTTYSYDPLNRLISITDALGYETNYSYDPVGNRISQIDPNGNVTSYTYDPLNRLITITDALGSTSVSTYDAVGNIILETDPKGNTTDYTYDELNRVIATTDALGGETSYTHDESGNVISETDSNGNVTSYTYDALNRILTTTDALGGVTSYTYDGVGNELSETDPNGHTTSHIYDALNQEIITIDPLVYETSYSYDPVGNRISETNARNYTTQYEYDPLNRLIRMTDAAGGETFYSYDGAGNKLSQTVPNGYTTHYTYDPLNRLIKTTDPLGHETDYTYDPGGNRISLTNTRNFTTLYEYDALDRLIRITDPLGGETFYSYDNVGNKISETNANSYTTTYAYDALYRIITETNPLGQTTAYTYDSVGNRIARIDANNNTTTYTYDPLNRLIIVTSALGNRMNYSYDPVGNRISQTDDNGNTTTYVYDALDRRTMIISPMGQKTQYTYDGVGNLRERTDPNGVVTSYGYDAMDRRVSVSYPDGTGMVYDYNPVGNLIRATNLGELGDVTHNSYDALGRLLSATVDYGLLFSKTVSYSYDEMGNRISMTTDSGTTTYVYDPLDRLVIINAPVAQITTYNYDDAGRMTQKTLPNSVYTTYSYDDADNLLNVTHHRPLPSPDFISSYSYTYDNVSNRVSMTDSYGGGGTFNRTYHYDPVYRLMVVDRTPWGSVTQYSYDPVGNRLTESAGGPPTIYTYDDDNKLLTRGTTNYSYNANGALASKTTPGGTTTYQYNFENKMTKVVQSLGSPATFQYSAAGGRRISKAASPTTYYMYVCYYCPICCHFYCEVVTMYDETGTEEASFTSGPQFYDETVSITQDGQTYYYLEDGLGSVVQIIDWFGNLACSYEYDAFGNSMEWKYAPVDNPFRFAGQEYDDNGIGLYYNTARYYDPEVGRFTSQDPLTTDSRMNNDGLCNGSCPVSASADEAVLRHHYPPIQEGNSDNLYAYVGNNPVNRVDPLGLYWWSVRARRDISPTTCALGGGRCGAAQPIHDPLKGILCEHKVNGTASCDISKPPSSPYTIKNYNKTCTRPCTQAHEEQHAKDRKACCDKARSAWADAAAQAIAGYRGRGMSAKTLAKKIKNVDRDKKVKAARRNVMNKWNKHVAGSSNWAECRGHGVSVACAEKMWKDKNCDCPKEEDKKCCRAIKKYLKNAKNQKKRFCKRSGADKAPKCPF